MTETSRKANLEFGVQNNTKSGLNEIKQDLQVIGREAEKSGDQARAAFDGMGKSSEDAAAKFTRSEARMVSGLRSTVEQMEIALRQSQGLADAFEFKAEFRGFDAAKLNPMLERVRELESQLSLVKAAEAEWAAQNAFAQKSQQAAQLSKASEYTNWWATELKKAEAVEAELLAQNAFAKKHQQATELAKASQYASWWAAELDKVEAAERRLSSETAFIKSLQSQSDAIGKTRADLLEMQAAQMGISAQAAPYIANLRQAEKGMQGVGMSAKAMGAAMRGVPAQISDIVVSLQGGMPVMTVFLQQGLQLRDMFGGFGAAGKALASTLVGMVNPYTVAAAAAVALGVAMAHAESTLRTQMSLMNQLEATGRAGYLNSAAIKQLKKDMSDLPGISKSAATAIISDLVQVRTLGGEALQKIALMSADFAAATGQNAAGAAKELAKAMEDPAKAARALDEAFNFMTLEQLIAIDAMDEAGNKAGAQQLLLNALGESLKGAADKQTDLQGASHELGKAWDDLMGNMSPSVETLNNISSGLAAVVRGINGLTESVPKANAEITKWLPSLQLAMGPLGMWARIKGLQTLGAEAGQSGGASGSWGPNSGANSGAPAATSTVGNAGVKSDADKELDALFEVTKGYRAKRDAAKELSETLGKLQSQQKRLRDEGRGDSKEAEKLQQSINGVNEKIKTLTKTSGDGAKKEQSAYATLAASIQGKIDANSAEIQVSGKLNEAQKAEIQLNADLRDGKLKLSAAHEADLRGRIAIWQQQEKDKEQAKRNVAIYQQQLDIGQQVTDDYVKRSKALEAARLAMDAYEKAAKEDFERLELESSLIGKSNQQRAVALAQYDAAIELKRKLAEIDKMDTVNGEPDREELRVRARAVYTQKLASAQTKAYNDEWQKSFDQTSQALTDALMRGGKDAGDYLKDYFRTLILRPVIKAIVDPIAAPITSGVQSLLGQGPGGAGFMNGGLADWSSWGANSSDWLMTQSTKLGMNGMTSMGDAAFALGDTIKGVDTWLKDIPGMSGGIGSAAGYLGSIYALSQGQYGSALGSAIGTYILPGIGTMIGGALGGLLDGLDNSGTPHMGAASTYNGGAVSRGWVPDSTWSAGVQATTDQVALSLGSALDAAAKTFGQKAGYTLSATFADDSSKDGAFGALKITDALGKVVADWTSYDPSWGGRWFDDGEAGVKQWLTATAGEVKGAILQMDLPGWARQILGAASDLDSINAALQQIGTIKAVFDSLSQTMDVFAGITSDLQTRLLNAAGGIDALANTVGAFYQGFYSEQERMGSLTDQLRQSLSALGSSIDPSIGEHAKVEFRDAVRGAMESGQVELAYQLMAMSSSFATAAEYAQKAATTAAEALQKARDTAVDNARANVQAAIDREKSYWSGIASTSQAAIGSLTSTLGLLTSNARELYGSVDSAQQMLAAQGMAYIEDALTAVRGGASASGFDKLQESISAARGGISGGVYATQFDRERDALVLAGQLSELGDLADSQLTVEERQLKAAQAQIDQLDQALGYWQRQIDGTGQLIDVGLSTVDAIAALAAALAAREAAKQGAAAGAGAGGAWDGVGPYQYGGGNPLMDSVIDYGNQYGSDAYYFIPGVNDYAAKQQSINDIAAITGQSASDLWGSMFGGLGADYWQAVQNASNAGAVVNASDSLDDILRKAGVPGYAGGGSHPGGWRMVGELGPELEYTGPSRIFNHYDTQRMLGGMGMGGNTERLEQLVEKVSVELQRLQTIVGEGNRAQSELLDITDQKSEGGSADRVRITNVQELAVAIKEVMA